MDATQSPSPTQDTDLRALEQEVFEKQQRIAELKRARVPEPVAEFALQDGEGEVFLRDLFGEKDDLVVVHNTIEISRSSLPDTSIFTFETQRSSVVTKRSSVAVSVLPSV